MAHEESDRYEQLNQYFDTPPSKIYTRFNELPQDIQDVITEQNLLEYFEDRSGNFLGANELIATSLDAGTVKDAIQNFSRTGGTLQNFPDAPAIADEHYTAPEYDDPDNEVFFSPTRYIISWKSFAQGGYGDIFLGIDCQTQKPVVIKTNLNQDEKQARALYKEALTLAFCADRHMMRVENVFIDDNKTYCVYEFLDPRDIPTFQKQRKDLDNLPNEERYQLALDVAFQMAGTLDHLYQEYGFLHRDLKPSNIFRDLRNNSIKIGDVGIASWVTDGTVGDKIILGTAEWVAPESFWSLEEKKDFSHESWSFANFVWFLFHTQNIHVTLRNWLNWQMLERHNALLIQKAQSKLDTISDQDDTDQYKPTENIPINLPPQLSTPEEAILKMLTDFNQYSEAFFKFIQENPDYLLSNIPPAAAAVFQKALSRDSSQRYTTLTEFVNDLADALGRSHSL